jgi:hypothetical protein
MGNVAEPSVEIASRAADDVYSLHLTAAAIEKCDPIVLPVARDGFNQGFFGLDFLPE